MPKNIVKIKADAFAIRIVNAYRYLTEEKKEKRMSDQLYRSGTAVQALIAEAEYAQSTADFINKMSIALKEANESRSWINLLHETGYFDDSVYNSIHDDINQIIIILIAIVRKTKENLKSK